MSTPRNIFAYTAPGVDCPPYISINEFKDQVHVTVRSPKESGGDTANMILPREQLVRLLYALRDERSKTVTAQLAVDNTIPIKVKK